MKNKLISKGKLEKTKLEEDPWPDPRCLFIFNLIKLQN